MRKVIPWAFQLSKTAVIKPLKLRAEAVLRADEFVPAPAAESDSWGEGVVGGFNGSAIARKGYGAVQPFLAHDFAGSSTNTRA